MADIRRLVVDLEDSSLNPFRGTIWILAFMYEGDRKPTVIHDCFGLKKKAVPKQVLKDLADPNVEVILQNGAHDGPYIAHHWGVWVTNVWDTMLCEQVIQGVQLPFTKKKSRTPYEEALYERHGSGLEYILPRYGFAKPDKSIREGYINRPMGLPFTKKELVYPGGDVKDLLPIRKAQEFILRRDGLLEVALLENEYLVKRIIPRKVHGIGWDQKIWRELANRYKAEYDRRIKKLPNVVDNWGSEKQVKTYFRNRGIVIPTYKSKRPDEDDLDSVFMRTRDKILGDFIFARELQKAVSSYGLSWFDDDLVEFDGRIHPDVNQMVETGRTSMRNPNLQQLPGYGRKDWEHETVMKFLYRQNKLSKFRWEHRKAFVPAKGCVYVIGDFSGQEIGIMAAASGETQWINALLRGDDVHALVASLLYKEEWLSGAERGCTFPKKCSCLGHLTPRERAKILNFMLAYGGGATRFSKNTGLNLKDSTIIVAKYRRVIPKLTGYLEKNARLSSQTGESFSADPYQRRRVLRSEIDWKVKNQGKNNPIQAAGANMLKLASISIPEKYYIPLEVHDEIVLEVPRGEAKEAARVLKSVMERSADYITGIKGLIKVQPRIANDFYKPD